MTISALFMLGVILGGLGLTLLLLGMRASRHRPAGVLTGYVRWERWCYRWRSQPYRHSGRLMQQLFDASPDPVAVISERGVYLTCNQAFAHMLGGPQCTVAQICGTRPVAWSAEDRVAFWASQEQQVLNSGLPVCYEDYFSTPDGTVRWLEITKSPCNGPEYAERAVLIVGRDITERKHTEQQLADAIMDLHTLSYFDCVTRIANRRHFEEQLHQQWRTHQRNQRSLALLLIDIDYFKAYNDRYGHQQGDCGLQAFAEVLTHSLWRPQDLVARYGGEEFVILLPETDERGAEEVARRIQINLRQADIPHSASDINGHLTCSIGIAAMQPSPLVHCSELVQQADLALYQAKSLGRNRICVTGETAHSVKVELQDDTQ
nr:diguanylate cyclase [Plesiomonas shigelloides]